MFVCIVMYKTVAKLASDCRDEIIIARAYSHGVKNKND